jgi:glycyl-tRNA synthetase beta chain
MQRAHVLASAGEREQAIRKALDVAARTISGARWREDADLLRTVVNLTEFPSVILGSFDHDYLALAEEVIVTVMRDHQKYFALEAPSGKLLPNFLAVLNIDGDPQGVIRHGNERVLRARLADARFFWEADQKIPLKARTELLRSVTFQKDLGSYRGKTGRVATLADKIAADLERRGVQSDRAALREAAFLAKTDLTTELVKEFTELQGIIGGLYAKAQGLPPTVADAIYDHYKPEHMDDAVPRTVEGSILSIADKADSVAGMFALGLAPSGSKDPFALRRQANGIVRVIAHYRWPLRLGALVAMAFESYVEQGSLIYSDTPATAHDSLHDFMRERLEYYLQEVKGYAYDVVNAVLAAGADELPDAERRAEAVSQVRGSEDFVAIGTSFKRMKNILRQAREAEKPPAEHLDAKKLQAPEEKELAAQLKKVGAEVEKLRASGDYASALRKMAALRPPIDAFFDKVMVMVEDEELRSQRLALLQELLNRFTTIADFSEVVTAGAAG